MKRWTNLRQNLVWSAVAGLVVGAALGLFETLVLVVFDLPLDRLLDRRLLYVVVAYGVLGLLGGLGLGLLRGLPGLGPTGWQAWRDPALAIQGMRAGLMAGAAVGVVDVLVLAIRDLTWRYVAGLPWAVIAYGVLGLLGGLGLGLLWGLGHSRRDRDDESAGRLAWIAITTLIFSLGTFLVVRMQIVRHLVLLPASVPFQLRKALILDGALLVVTGLGTGLVLWLLLRRLFRGGRATRIIQARWSLAAYVAVLAVAALLSVAPGLVVSLANQRPAATGIPPDLHDRPNIIFIVADALRADRLGCYDHPGHLTPYIDALAQDGVVYRHMSAQASWTMPSVATMLTSLYPSSHRAVSAWSLLPDSITTLPEVLREQGYRTAGFTTNTYVSSVFNFQQGFDEYTYLEPSLPFFASPAASELTLFAALSRLREVFLPTRAALPPGELYQDAATLNQCALTWLEENRQVRFFLYLHYMDPHDPYYAHPYDGRTVGCAFPVRPDPSEAPAMRRLYDGEVAFLDAHLGALFDRLKAQGLYEDTLIVFTADHGEEFQEHGGWWHSTTLYEEVLAVPLVVKYPGNIHAGTVDEAFARGLDLAPTILDVIGFPIPATMQGVSLRPGAEVERGEFAFGELNTRWDNVLQSIRTPQRKLIVVKEGNRRGLPPVALFDLRTDPGEQRNLADDEPDTVRSLHATLNQIIAFAEAHAVVGQSAELDPVTRERLRRLGY